MSPSKPPSKPKGPPRPRGRGAAGERHKRMEVELPFDDVEPLRADDPAPQHVPQFPAQSRRAVQVLKDAELGVSPDGDEESTAAVPRKPPRAGAGAVDVPLPARFAEDELEALAEPGFTPAGLYVERGPGVGQLAPVRQGVMLIGRASSADLRLQHPSISRRHSQLTRKGERFFLKDLGSQNGTYVNQVRIDREVELFAGDEVLVGTCQLRLRGPNGVDETMTPRPRVDPRRTAGPSLLAVAIASCAVGIALATAIIFVAFKLMRAPDPMPAEAVVARIEEPVPATAQPLPEPPPSEPARTPAPATAVMAPAKAPVPTPKATRAPARRTSAPAAQAKPDAAVLARYEAGDVDGAMALARSKGLAALTARLTRFRTEYAAGLRALEASDDVTALRRLETARRLDEELAGGWGTLNGELRQQLSRAHVLAAARQARAGDVAGARRSLATALRLDPKNTAAQAELARLARTNAIDAAFEDARR